MDKKYKSMLFTTLVFMILIISTSTLSAADTSEIILNDENNEIISAEETIAQENENSHLSDSETPILKDEESGSISELNTEISGNEIVNLEKNYTYDDVKDSAYKNGIVINKEVTINGNNNIINANGQLLFNINNDGSLTLKDLTILNSYSNTNAMIKNSGKLILDNVTFTCERILSSGSQTYNTIENTGEMEIKNSTFKESSISLTVNNGNNINFNGLIYNNGGTLTVEDSIFKDNTIKSDTRFGRAPRISALIYNYNSGNLKLINTAVTNNLVNYQVGTTPRFDGFIRNAGKLEIEKSIFANNEATFATSNTNFNGIINVESGEINMKNSIISNNTHQNVAVKFGTGTVDYNYWGSNIPSFDSLSSTKPNNYIILNITGEETAQVGSDNTYQITLNQVNANGEISNLEGSMPDYAVNVSSNQIDTQEVIIKNSIGNYIYNPTTEGEDTITVTGMNSETVSKDITIEKSEIPLITIEKISELPTAYVNDTIKFTINVTNKGTGIANNVKIRDLLPSGLKFVIANGTYSENEQEIIWTITSLNINESYIVELEATVLVEGEIENNAYASCDENETETKAYATITGEIKPFDGNEIYVDGTVESTGTGTNDSPFKTITEAVELANTAKNPVTIYVLEGNYTDKNMIVKNNITISSYNNGKVVLDANNEDGFIYNDNKNNNLTLIGLTFQNGRKITSDYSDGGVVKSEGPLAVINCTFINNTARKGGAIHAENGANITNSNFINNTAQGSQGGAAYISGDANLINTTFENNTATGGSGGAVRVQGNLNVENSTFNNNKAGSKRSGDITNGGAISATDSSGSGYNPSTINVKNTEFKNNDAFNGGAISSGDKVNVTVDNSSFIGNKAVYGAGISANDGNVNITNSVLANNTVSDEYNTKGLGDGVGVNVQNGAVDLKGNVIENNSNPYNNNAVDVTVNKGDIDANGNYWGENQTPRVKSNNGEVIVDPEDNNKINPSISAETKDIKEGETLIITVKLPNDATSNVIATINNSNYTGTITNGQGTINVNGLKAGEYNNITVTYLGNNKYNTKTTTVKATVNESNLISTTISAEKLIMTVKDGSKFTVKLTDSDGNPIAGKTILIHIVGKTYHPITDKNGIATLPINLNPKSYDVTAQFAGDEKYKESSTVSTTVEVTAKVRIDKDSDLTKDYLDNSKPFKVRALDKYGKAVGAGEIVKMSVAGKTYSVKTDAKGYASLPINLAPKTWTITVTYGGYSVKHKITVKQVLSAQSNTFKKAKSYKYTATLKSSTGKGISGKTIKFTIAGKTYTAKTNSKGIATAIINQSLAAGKYNIISKYEGTSITKTITIKK